MEYTDNEIKCPSGKPPFLTRSAIYSYIDKRNSRCGGDSFRAYRCRICGCWHLTTNTVYGENLLRKPSRKYNRLQKKAGDLHLLKIYGVI